MSVATLLRASLLALFFVSGGGALTALAADGGPRERGHPPSASPIPLTVLRPSAIQTGPATTAPQVVGAELMRPDPPRRELVLLVGGYGTSPNDPTFDELSSRFPPTRYEVRRLGQDPAFPYDPYGHLDASAAALTAEIRSLRSDYAAVNIVSHSMGGAVVDRAFAQGLSRDDGVRTYIAIAGPHSGATFARVPGFLLPRIAPVADIVRAFFVSVLQAPSSDAARDLANLAPIPPPAGVTRLDISLASDGFVSAPDARDPGVEQRVLLPETPCELIDGHGGSLTSRAAGDLIFETVRTHEVPPDKRGGLALLLAASLWTAAQDYAWLLLTALAACAALLFLLRDQSPFRFLIDSANRLAGAYLRSRGR